MDFIFVGFPRQQKWKQFWRFHDIAKFSVLIQHTVLKYWYNSIVSSTMILYIRGSSVRTVVSKCQDSNPRFYHCRRTCMHFSCTALLWDASLRIMENDEILGAIVTILCHGSSAVDSRQWSRDDRKTENAFLLKTKILCWEDHTFSIWLMWLAEFLCFPIRTEETKMTDKSECRNCFCW
jgi:hypothetical protein